MGAIGAVMLAVNDALAPFGVIVEHQPLSSGMIRGLLAAAPLPVSDASLSEGDGPGISDRVIS